MADDFVPMPGPLQGVIRNEVTLAVSRQQLLDLGLVEPNDDDRAREAAWQARMAPLKAKARRRAARQVRRTAAEWRRGVRCRCDHGAGMLEE